MSITDPYLHVHAQPYWHAPAFIVGTREGLMELARILLNAVHDGKDSAEFMTSDGEGYSILVAKIKDVDFYKAITPYTDEVAGDNRENTIKPWELVWPDEQPKEEVLPEAAPEGQDVGVQEGTQESQEGEPRREC